MDKSLKNFSIPLSFETQPTNDIPLSVFLFSRNDKLLATSTVHNQSIELKNLETNPRLYKIYIAPATDKKIAQVRSLAQLERFKPFEVVLDINHEGIINPIKIPNEFATLWLLRSCRVRGKVIKNFSIGSVAQDHGICHARVHICEVDRILWLVKKIPDHIIKKIPEIIATPQWPFPIPEPEPFNAIRSIASELNPQPLPPKSKGLDFNAVSEFSTKASLLSRGADSNRVLSAEQLSTHTAPSELIASQAVILASPNIINSLNSGNTAAIRTAIVENFSLFHPYFCHIRWLWPYFYRYDQVALVYTDLNGAFDTNFLYWNDGDKPDLYFWVEYLMNGVWTTVYKPSIPCHTYWNYACASQVTIRVTDPRVRWECNDVIDGDIVWIKTIGSSASVTHIKQKDEISVIQGKAFNHIGLSDVFMLSSSSSVPDAYRRPFGGTLNFIVQFGSGLPANGMYYYRWSYHKLRTEDLFILPLSAPISLHHGQELIKTYSYEYYDSALHKHFDKKPFTLGPIELNGEKDLYIIPPAYPSSSPVNATELSPLWDQNTLTISVDSTQLDDGLYEFFLELFDANGHKLSSIPRHLFQVPDYGTFAPSFDVLDEYLVLNGSSSADAFKMQVRIDNSQCEANIFKIKVNGTEVTSDCCGFVPYPPNANIEVAFRAYHPQNFATFDFKVQKGTCSDPSQQGVTDASGMVIGNANLYNRDSASIYRHSFTPAQLLGLCVDGGKAAFAELLIVKALATNGYDQLSYLNASDLAAFALEPA